MNCPKCRSGILEPVGYIELKTGPIELTIDPEVPDQTPALQIRICSKDPCGYVFFEAAPASLSLAKRMFRDIRYKTGAKYSIPRKGIYEQLQRMAEKA